MNWLIVVCYFAIGVLWIAHLRRNNDTPADYPILIFFVLVWPVLFFLRYLTKSNSNSGPAGY